MRNKDSFKVLERVFLNVRSFPWFCVSGSPRLFISIHVSIHVLQHACDMHVRMCTICNTYVWLVRMYMLLVFTHSWLVHTPG